MFFVTHNSFKKILDHSIGIQRAVNLRLFKHTEFGQNDIILCK